MALLRYEPWNTMARLHREIEHIFGDSASAPASNDEQAVAWIPAVDIHEQPDKFIVRADLPGVESKDINVTADQGVLTLSGRRQSEQRDERKGFTRIERVEGTFLRRFTLPESVRADDIRARHSNGVLELTLPKVPAPEPKRVAVETH